MLATTTLCTMLAGLAALGSAAVLPTSKRGLAGCACPTYNDPSGSCVIVQRLFTDPNQDGSAICVDSADTQLSTTSPPAFQYTCGGSFNQPNCNLCTQSTYGNYGGLESCDGNTFCSGDNGLTFHICGSGETPFVPKFNTLVTFGTSRVKTAGANFNLQQLNDTFVRSIEGICFAGGCETNPTVTPSQDINFVNAEGTISKGTLNFTVPSANFLNVDERNAMIQLASLTVQKASTCQQVKYHDGCQPSNGGSGSGLNKRGDSCNILTTTICTGPSNINIQMRDHGNLQDIHSSMSIDLGWTEPKTTFDCDAIASIVTGSVDTLASMEPEAKDAAAVVGKITTLCSIADALTGK